MGDKTMSETTKTPNQAEPTNPVPLVQAERLVMPDAPGELELGDYVFATRWPDADWNDPWAIGYVGVIGKNYIELRQEDNKLIPGVGLRGFKFAKTVSREQADLIIAEYKPREGTEFLDEIIALIFDKA
jgi:hypothetical protein